ncbi:unnamed protein product [Blepharisma stoltei]|uniref:Protein kinase domain-containing protein n=1 Tax=Blepharisma stoltei TaxID=1481888 RepID=A0AAU9JDS2_9CILI|nr:unnamed protein product [Blepharisma stoltei]
MPCIFDQPDDDFCETFWAYISRKASDRQKITLNSSCHHGYLTFLHKGNQKRRYFILKDSFLYYCKSYKDLRIIKYTNISWKRLEVFTETQEKLEKFGFKIVGSRGSMDFYVDNEDSLAKWLPSLQQQMINIDIEDDYIFIKEVGKGNFGYVFEGECIENRSKVAIKSITKSMVKRSYLERIVKEIEILRKIRHPYIVNILRVYESEDCVHLVLDYVEGGELYQTILHKSKFSERKVAKFANKFLQLMVFMQEKNIVHRDLKPENILLVNKNRITNFKLCDFGFAEEASDEGLDLVCGSPGYVAPEILNQQKYYFKADVFSLGIILYILLSGRAPFSGIKAAEILKKNKKCHIVFYNKYWRNISPEAAAFVSKLTDISPLSRYSAVEALNDKWLQMNHKKQKFNEAEKTFIPLEIPVVSPQTRDPDWQSGNDKILSIYDMKKLSKNEPLKKLTEMRRPSNTHIKGVIKELRMFDLALMKR